MLPGPCPGARPGVGTRRRAPCGRVFARGTQLGKARRSNLNLPSCRLTTHKKVQKVTSALWFGLVSLPSRDSGTSDPGGPMGFLSCCETLDQLYTVHRLLGGSWEFAQPTHMCIVDLEINKSVISFSSPVSPESQWWWAETCGLGHYSGRVHWAQTLILYILCRFNNTFRAGIGTDTQAGSFYAVSCKKKRQKTKHQVLFVP